MISAEADDLGPVLGVATLDWDDGGESRRLAQPGGAAPQVTVTIGQPLGWWGAARPGGKDADRWMIVRFAASFRADPGTRVEWSRLSIELPEDGDSPLIAIDQYPADVLEEEERDIQLTLSPHLKLMQVDASLGSAATTIKVARVIPVISPWGGQESSFGWDLTSTDKHPISGVRHLYAVLQCPSPELSLSVSLEADAQASGRIWRGTPLNPSRQRDVNVLLQSWG
jgi:hypothetical protein